jgi:hypothetical protein
MDKTGDNRVQVKGASARVRMKDPLFAPRKRKAAPFPFVLEALAPLEPRTNVMFGCLAVYVGEKIVLILRDRPADTADNGVWIATTIDHHASLRRELPSLRSVHLFVQRFGKKETDWQVLPADAADFEEAVLRACALILARDPRIGKVPKGKSGRGAKTRRTSSGTC